MAFAQSHNFRIDNSHFVSANQAVFLGHSRAHDPTHAQATTAKQQLFNHTAIEATHESASAAYAPRCKEGTREEVIRDILTWAREPRSASATTILWFSGPAGGGKTCIQREVAQRLQNEGRLAASYFFSNRAVDVDPTFSSDPSISPGSLQHAALSMSRPGRALDVVDPFIATVAYQLATLIPGLMEFIERAIQDDPLILQKSLHIQAENLISRPLSARTQIQVRQSQAPPSQVRRKRRWWPFSHVKALPSRLTDSHTVKAICDPDTVVVDAWDEIRDHERRKQLFHVLRQLSLHTSSPLRFIVASRPEHDIRTMMRSHPFKSITRRIKLEDYDGDDDIRGYLCDELARVRETHPARDSIPLSWPSEHMIETLVRNSSGQFIYPSVIVRLLDDPKRHPVPLLDEVLKRAPKQLSGASHPLAELYGLYSLILEAADVEQGLLRRILHLIGVREVAPRTLQFIDELLNLPPGTASIALCNLHSLISVPESSHSGPTERVTFYHKSITDYLSDASLSGPLSQPTGVTFGDVAECCLRHLIRWGAMDDTGRLQTHSEALDFAVYYWDFFMFNALQMCEYTFSSEMLDDFHPSIPWVYGHLHIPLDLQELRIWSEILEVPAVQLQHTRFWKRFAHACLIDTLVQRFLEVGKSTSFDLPVSSEARLKSKEHVNLRTLVEVDCD